MRETNVDKRLGWKRRIGGKARFKEIDRISTEINAISIRRRNNEHCDHEVNRSSTKRTVTTTEEL